MKKSFTALFALSTIILSGCSTAATSNSENASYVYITHTITNAEGKIESVTEQFKENPKVVATFSLGALDMFDTIGLDQLGIKELGLAKSNMPASLKKYESNSYFNVGTLFEPDMTALTLLKPDLIILDGRTTGKYSELKTKFPNVNVLDASITNYSLEKHKVNADNFAKIFSKASTNFTSNMTRIETRMNALKAKTGSHDALFVMHNQGNLSVFGQGSRYGTIFNDFGYGNADQQIGVAADLAHGSVVTNEYFSSLGDKIEVVFLLDRNKIIDSPESNGLDAFKTRDLIKELKVVKENHVYELNAEAWYTVSGGFNSVNTMIDDAERYINDLNK